MSSQTRLATMTNDIALIKGDITVKGQMSETRIDRAE
jgi:hypothetical protein